MCLVTFGYDSTIQEIQNDLHEGMAEKVSLRNHSEVIQGHTFWDQLIPHIYTVSQKILDPYDIFK